MQIKYVTSRTRGLYKPRNRTPQQTVQVTRSRFVKMSSNQVDFFLPITIVWALKFTSSSLAEIWFAVRGSYIKAIRQVTDAMPAIAMNVFLQPMESRNNCRRGPITSDPPEFPQLTIPVAWARLLMKYRGTTTKLAVYTQQVPKPTMKLYVKYMQKMLGAWEVNRRPRTHVRPPEKAVRRHPYRSQRFAATGPSRVLIDKYNDPTQAGKEKKID